MQKRHLAIAFTTLLIAIGSIFAVVSLRSTPAHHPEDTPRHTPSPTRQLTGRVLSHNLTPIPNVKLSLAQLHATSDERGEFSFPIDNLSDGEHLLTIDPASVPDWIIPSEDDSPPARPVSLSATTAPPRQDLILRAPASIQARLITTDANPAPPSTVSAQYAFTDGLNGPIQTYFSIDDLATSSPQGALSLPRLPPGRLRLLIRTPNMPDTLTDELILRDGQHLDELTIVIGTSQNISLSVLDTSGRPIPNASLTLRGPHIPKPTPLTLSPDGRARRSQLAEGVYTAIATAPGYVTEQIELELLAEDGPELVRELVMEPTSGLTGSVIDHESKPVRSAQIKITCQNHSAPTTILSDYQGNFRLPSASGSCHLQAFHPQHSPSEATTADGNAPATLAMRPGLFIHGQVTDPRGIAVTSYTLTVDRVEGTDGHTFNPRHFSPLQVEDASGRFKLGPLTPGTFDLRATPAQMGHGTAEALSLKPGADLTDVKIVVEPFGKVEGFVRAKDGSPIPNAFVEIFDSRPQQRTSTASTDAKGYYTIQDVTSGRRSIRVTKDGFLTLIDGGFQIEPNRLTRRDITLEVQDPDARFAFFGIGATLRRDGTNTLVQKILDGSPAQAAGLLENDIILFVDDAPTNGLAIERVIDLIRGAEGTPVRLRISRDGQPLSLNVTRGRVVVTRDL
jgi:protocatechuate 3,4-dioxygenase beta subunit